MALPLPGQCGRAVKAVLAELTLRSPPIVPHPGSDAWVARRSIEDSHDASRNLRRHYRAIVGAAGLA
jgi:hypothetical protein